MRRRRISSLLLSLVAILLCACATVARAQQQQTQQQTQTAKQPADAASEPTKSADDRSHTAATDAAATPPQPTTVADAAPPARAVPEALQRVMEMLTAATQTAASLDAAAAQAAKRKEDEAKDIRYVVGLLASAPALPASAGSASGSRTMVMTAQSGQKFRCTIPHRSAESTLLMADTYRPPTVDESEQHKTNNAATATGASARATAASATPAAAAAPIVPAPAPAAHPTIRTVPDSKLVPSLVRSTLGNGCFTKLVDYWTYEVCPFRRVRQYHRQPDNQAISVEFSLGAYTAAGDQVDAAGISAGVANAAGSKPVQYTQLFEGGTNNRQSVVRFLCNSDPQAQSSNNQHLLMEVREPRPFHYEFVIRTTLMCRDAQGRLGTSDDVLPTEAAHPSPAAASSASAAPAKSGVGQGVHPGAEPTNAAPQQPQPTPPGVETGRLRTGAFRRKTASASASASGASSSASASSSSAPRSPSPNVMDLLEPLGSECLYLNTGWWTYKFCYLKEITQFHREQIQIPIQQTTSVKAGAGGTASAATPTPQQPEPIPVKLGARSAAEAAANIAEAAAANQAAAASFAAATGATHVTKLVTTAEFTLGLLPPSTSLESIESATTVVLGDSWESTYVSQHYHSGTTCDLNGRPRSTETRIFCDMHLSSAADKQVAVIKSVVESATCQYIVIIHSPLMCAHPSFKPLVPKTVEITCEPITNDGKPMSITAQPPNFATVASLLFQP